MNPYFPRPFLTVSRHRTLREKNVYTGNPLDNRNGTRSVSDHATWNDDAGRYELPSLKITSDDGDNWITLDGRHAAGSEFDATIIMLCGGPRDGTIVS